MLGFSILLIIVGLLAAAFGVLMNTILLSLFDTNLAIVRMHDYDAFSIAWIFSGPGTIVLIIGILVVILGIALIVIRGKRNSRMREINRNVKQTNRRREQQGKRVRR